jgi:hypothetical protein
MWFPSVIGQYSPGLNLIGCREKSARMGVFYDSTTLLKKVPGMIFTGRIREPIIGSTQRCYPNKLLCTFKIIRKYWGNVLGRQ